MNHPILYIVSFLLAACGTNPGGTLSQLSGASQVFAGNWHTCAVKSDGLVRCWGFNSNAQLGNEVTTNSFSAITATVAPTGISKMALGKTHTCAVASSGLQCWGYAPNGLGNGTTSTNTPIVPTGMDQSITSVAVTADSTCAIKSGAVFCWGGNSRGKLGDGTVTARATPTAALVLTSDTESITGNNLMCAIKSGAAYCWGWFGWDSALTLPTYFYQKTPTAVTGLGSGVTSISASGEWHACAIKDGGAYCFGVNDFGQLGNNTQTNSLATAVAVSNLTSGVTEIATGGMSSCAIADSEVYCWGDNSAGQLGDGSTTASAVPVKVTGLTGATSLTLGRNYACVIHQDRVRCWGHNIYGQLGNNTLSSSSTPGLVVESTSQSADVISAIRSFFHSIYLWISRW